jgi:hypothetical protein
MIKMLAATALLLALPGPEEDYPALVTSAAAKERQRDDELRAAHRALDEGAYDRAVELAKHARELDGEIVRIRGEARACLGRLVAQLVQKLDDDEFAVREGASERLRGLGSVAVPGLIRHRKSEKSPETRYRIDELLRGISVDDQGRVRQWAIEATASSEYGTTDWSASQVAGEPDSQEGDSRTAWAAKEADGGPEWLRLKFPAAVRVSKIRVHENLTPGGVVAVDVIGEDGVRRRAWEGEDRGVAWFEADLQGFVGREIVIVLDTKKHEGWEEVDAVEVIGELP